MSWKRPLYLFHRWVGIFLCLFFALWFISGLFMMYVEFPQLTRLEQLAGLPALNFSTATVSPATAISRLHAGDFNTVGAPDGNTTLQVENSGDAIHTFSGIRLGSILNRPVYFIYNSNRTQPKAIFADNGELLKTVTPIMAQAIAANFINRSHGKAELKPEQLTQLTLIQTDQWTVSSALNAHRPLFKLALPDESGTELYVSSTTGEVVRDSKRSERTLNYFAAVTHWIYPTFIRRHPEFWAWVVDILSTVGTVLAVSGIWIGILRWRRNYRPGQSAVPYKGLMRWHYFMGIIFGLTTITWVLSGLLSMNPGNINPSRSVSDVQLQVFSGKSLTPEDFNLSSLADLGSTEAVAAELLHYESQPFIHITQRDGSEKLIPGTDSATHLPHIEALLAHASLLLPGATLARTMVMTEYDNYYYSRRPERDGKPLPIIRAEFTDPDKTWFHINATTGQVIEQLTAFNRAYRWLYNGLHSFDIWWLWQRRPLWDIVVITFSVGGLGLSMLGIVIGIRRLRMKYGSTPVSYRRTRRNNSSSENVEMIR